MTCEYCTLEERTARNQEWREGPQWEFDDCGTPLVVRIESEGSGYILYIEHTVDEWSDPPEWTAANVPITHCPWCGELLGKSVER